jgi:hypothetical protein
MKKTLSTIMIVLTAIISLTLTTIQTQANTQNYSITFIQNESINNDGTFSTSNEFWSRTNKIEIINQSIILDNQLSKFTMIAFYNNNTYLGHSFTGINVSTFFNTNKITDLNNNISNFFIPNNATHFAISARNDDIPQITNNQISFTTFQSLIISYSTPAPAIPEGSIALTWTNDLIGQVHQRSNGALQTVNGNRTTAISVPSNQITVSDYMLIAHISLFDSNNQFIGTLYNKDRWLDPFDRQLSNLGEFDSNNITLPSSPNFTVDNIVFNNYYDNLSTIMVGRSQSQFNQLTATATVQGLYYVFYANWNGTAQVQFGPYAPGDTFDHTAEAIQQLGSALNREGFEFNGTFDGPNVMGTNNFVKYAEYTQLTTYTVIFQDYDGTVLATATVVEGFPATPPVTPTRNGYTFTGWEPPIAIITGDITTVAQYTPNTYLLTWNSDANEIKAAQAAHDTTILSHAPFVTKENHVLVGWTIDPTQNSYIWTISYWTIITNSTMARSPTYTVVWRDPSFNTLKIEYVIESGLATPPTYNPGTGLILTGWSPDPSQPITANTTFVALVTTAPTPPPPTTPENYSPIADLFGGVNTLIYLFVSMSLGLWILKAIRG